MNIEEKISQALFTTSECKMIDGEKTFIISDSTEDRQGEVISVDGWDIKNYKENPVILWAHNPVEPAIGIGTKVSFRTVNGQKKLTFVPQFHKKTELSRIVSDLVDEGIIRATSVGFLPKECDGNVFTKQELLEVSFVNVPANPKALSLMYSKGYRADKVKQVLSAIEIDNSIAYTKYALADIEASWDASKEVSGADVNDLKKMCAWYDSQKSDTKGSYKLAHHHLTGFRTNWAGVKSAMATLMGANGGVEIPENEKKAAYDHLAKHYRDFEKQVPAFRTMNEMIEKYAQGQSIDDAVNENVRSINTLVGELQEYKRLMDERFENGMKQIEEDKKIRDEEFLKYKSFITDELYNMKLNVKGLESGIKPDDAGLNDRFMAIEDSISNVATAIKEVSTYTKSLQSRDTGRDPKIAVKAVIEDKNRNLAMKVLNRAVETLNKIDK
jgi:hypothetical protein